MTEWSLLVAALGVALPALISAIVSAYVAVSVKKNATVIGAYHEQVNGRLTEMLRVTSELAEAIGYRRGVKDGCESERERERERDVNG